MSERKNPPIEKKAASLQYDGKNAPVITSAASGELAEEIIVKALLFSTGIAIISNLPAE